MNRAVLEAELRKVDDGLMNAYWTYTRCARGQPPAITVPHLYQRKREFERMLAGGRMDRPIIFTTDNVRKILARTKTQTRRVIKPQPESSDLLVPSFEVGARLWVREKWRTAKTFDPISPSAMEEKARAAGYAAGWGPVAYYDDEHNSVPVREFGGEWGRPRSPLHMPRWASRCALRVRAVRIQRLNEIAADDAAAEGATFTDYGLNAYQQQRPGWSMFATSSSDACLDTAQLAFANAWNVIHGGKNWNCNGKSEPWRLNPWVIAITFEVA